MKKFNLWQVITTGLIVTGAFLFPREASAYITVPSTGASYTFTSGNTYYVANNATFTGSLTFQPNCCIKYAQGASLTADRVIANGDLSAPAILTSVDDNSIGETIPGSTGQPGYTASTALTINRAFPYSCNGLIIRWANNALSCNSGAYFNIGIENCDTGIVNNSTATVTAQGTSYHANVQAPYTGPLVAAANTYFPAYANVVSGSAFTFQSGKTYYVSSPVVFTGIVRLQPDCVIKYADGASIESLYRTYIFNDLSAPSILTSKDDDLRGLPIDGSTGCPSVAASTALIIHNNGLDHSYTGLKILWANTALDFRDTVTGHTAWVEAIFAECDTAIVAHKINVYVQGQSAQIDVTTPWVAYEGANVGGLPSSGNQFLPIQSLKTAVVSEMQARMNSHSPATDKPIWLGSLGSPTPSLNPNCWLAGVQGLSSTAVGVYLHDTNGNLVTSSIQTHGMGCTLITPRHAIVAAHMRGPFASPQVLVFVGTDNQIYTNHTAGYTEVPGFDDLGIVAFEHDMDPHVEVAKILPATVLNKARFNLPCIGISKPKHAFPIDATCCYSSGNLSFAQQSQFADWEQPVADGDSGSPAFMLINGEIALIGGWYGIGVNGTIPFALASWAGRDINAVNAAIANLNNPSGYTVTPIDLSAFPDL